MLQTFEGTVQSGHIRLPAGTHLPEGARVYVTIVPTLDEHSARRKAARWLAEYVGDMVMPGPATLIHESQRTIWRLPAMVGSPFDEPRGPIGYVNVDAETGTVLSSPTLAGEMIKNAERLDSSVLPTTS
jgi:hypothetical protein